MKRGNPIETLTGQRINVIWDIMVSPSAYVKEGRRMLWGSRLIGREVLSDWEPSFVASVSIYLSIYLSTYHTLKTSVMPLLCGKLVCSR